MMTNQQNGDERSLQPSQPAAMSSPDSPGHSGGQVQLLRPPPLSKLPSMPDGLFGGDANATNSATNDSCNAQGVFANSADVVAQALSACFSEQEKLEVAQATAGTVVHTAHKLDLTLPPPADLKGNVGSAGSPQIILSPNGTLHFAVSGFNLSDATASGEQAKEEEQPFQLGPVPVIDITSSQGSVRTAAPQRQISEHESFATAANVGDSLDFNLELDQFANVATVVDEEQQLQQQLLLQGSQDPMASQFAIGATSEITTSAFERRLSDLMEQNVQDAADSLARSLVERALESDREKVLQTRQHDADCVTPEEETLMATFAEVAANRLLEQLVQEMTEDAVVDVASVVVHRCGGDVRLLSDAPETGCDLLRAQLEDAATEIVFDLPDSADVGKTFGLYRSAEFRTRDEDFLLPPSADPDVADDGGLSAALYEEFRMGVRWKGSQHECIRFKGTRHECYNSCHDPSREDLLVEMDEDDEAVEEEEEEEGEEEEEEEAKRAAKESAVARRTRLRNKERRKRNGMGILLSSLRKKVYHCRCIDCQAERRQRGEPEPTEAIEVQEVAVPDVPDDVTQIPIRNKRGRGRPRIFPSLEDVLRLRGDDEAKEEAAAVGEESAKFKSFVIDRGPPGYGEEPIKAGRRHGKKQPLSARPARLPPSGEAVSQQNFVKYEEETRHSLAFFDDDALFGVLSPPSSGNEAEENLATKTFAASADAANVQNAFSSTVANCTSLDKEEIRALPLSLVDAQSAPAAQREAKPSLPSSPPSTSASSDAGDAVRDAPFNLLDDAMDSDSASSKRWSPAIVDRPATEAVLFADESLIQGCSPLVTTESERQAPLSSFDAGASGSSANEEPFRDIFEVVMTCSPKPQCESGEMSASAPLETSPRTEEAVETPGETGPGDNVDHAQAGEDPPRAEVIVTEEVEEEKEEVKGAADNPTSEFEGSSQRDEKELASPGGAESTEGRESNLPKLHSGEGAKKRATPAAMSEEDSPLVAEESPGRQERKEGESMAEKSGGRSKARRKRFFLAGSLQKRVVQPQVAAAASEGRRDRKRSFVEEEEGDSPPPRCRPCFVSLRRLKMREVDPSLQLKRKKRRIEQRNDEGEGATRPRWANKHRVPSLKSGTGGHEAVRQVQERNGVDTALAFRPRQHPFSHQDRRVRSAFSPLCGVGSRAVALPESWVLEDEVLQTSKRHRFSGTPPTPPLPAAPCQMLVDDLVLPEEEARTKRVIRPPKALLSQLKPFRKHVV